MANRDLATLLRTLDAKNAHDVEVRVVRNTLAIGPDTAGTFEAGLVSAPRPRTDIGRTEYGLLLAAGAQHAPHPVLPGPDAIAPVFNCQECGEPMHRPQKTEVPGARDAVGASTVAFYCAKCHAELFGDLERD